MTSFVKSSSHFLCLSTSSPLLPSLPLNILSLCPPLLLNFDAHSGPWSLFSFGTPQNIEDYYVRDSKNEPSNIVCSPFYHSTLPLTIYDLFLAIYIYIYSRIIFFMKKIPLRHTYMFSCDSRMHHVYVCVSMHEGVHT